MTRDPPAALSGSRSPGSRRRRLQKTCIASVSVGRHDMESASRGYAFRHSSRAVCSPQRRELLRPPRLLHSCRRALREASAPGDQLTVRRRSSAGGPAMRAVVITKPGGLEVLGVAARPVRDAGPGEPRSYASHDGPAGGAGPMSSSGGGSSLVPSSNSARCFILHSE
jgi:hypothetical protein